jgi:hypothetical protein
MSNQHYRAQPAQPAQPHYDPAVAARQREIGKVLFEVGKEFFQVHGGKELDCAIALLSAFAVDGQEYVKKLLRNEATEIEARKAAELPKPDETKLPEGPARELVKKARRARPVIDAASATRLCKLLIDLVQLREGMLQKMTGTVEELFMLISNGKGMDTTMPVDAIAKMLRAEAQLA